MCTAPWVGTRSVTMVTVPKGLRYPLSVGRGPCEPVSLSVFQGGAGWVFLAVLSKAMYFLSNLKC